MTTIQKQSKLIVPLGATHFMPDNDAFKGHYIKVVYDTVYTWIPNTDKSGHWSSSPLHSDINKYLTITPIVKFDFVYCQKDCKSLFEESENELLVDWADAQKEREHPIDVALIKHKDEPFSDDIFIGGVSACCGKDDNSRGTGFTLRFDCIYIKENFQGAGLGRELIDQTIISTLMYYPFENTPNETCIEFAIASTKGAYCAWSLFNKLQIKLANKKTTCLLFEESYGYIDSLDKLEEAIEQSPYC